MEGTRTLAAVVAEASATLAELVLGEAALLGAGDLLLVERRLQEVLRQVGSVVVSGVLNQRALYRSAQTRWEVWWASHPLRRLCVLPPLAAETTVRAAAPAGAAPPTPVPAALAPRAATPPPPACLDPCAGATGAAATPPPATATRIATAGKPWGNPPDHWRRQTICHKRSA